MGDYGGGYIKGGGKGMGDGVEGGGVGEIGFVGVEGGEGEGEKRERSEG